MKVLSWDVGTKTLSYCLLEVVDGAPTVHAWETIDVHAEAGLSDKAKPTMKEDAEYVVDVMHRRYAGLWAHGLDAVIIEQQPAGGSNRFCSVRMKSISHVIHAYFYAQQLGAETRIPISFVSPSSKLVGMDTGETAADSAARRDGDRTAMGAKYRRNKKHAVDTTARLLADMAGADAARATFEAAAKKQDDLSDCFLLAYAFVRKSTAVKRKAPARKPAARKAPKLGTIKIDSNDTAHGGQHVIDVSEECGGDTADAAGDAAV